MIRTTRSIALVGIVGSLALVACDNPDARRPATETAPPVVRSAPQANETTAMDQSNASEHIDITASIRRAVMNDDALSTRAKNVLIVTDGTGTVTLRGDVPSQAEKNLIAAKADSVVGAARVVNRLVVVTTTDPS